MLVIKQRRAKRNMVKMNPKLTGYDFWNDVLKRPQYVAAPMVDMSELSFRMLCRRYKSQLCFSPMLHSQQFLQDSLYRSDTFSTCPEDRPLIVQFCSNDPTDFVNAATLVSSQCDGIDLNLGCPQAIARKGHYGAFLQDDWDLIHSIVRKAATDLPVPVTCKMRILPGPASYSVQYAKMLEDSGCSVLIVHGRTREQKGHATGLASWEIIKEIKASVNIPVIANGNILSFTDVKDCLEYTGADAVMSAEALLHNPSLFSGKNPPVWKIVREYLQYAEKYNTPLRCVRCHLFKILYLCIHQDEEIQQILAEGKSFTDFYSVCDLLKDFPKKYQSPSNREIIDTDSNLDGIYFDVCESVKFEPDLDYEIPLSKNQNSDNIVQDSFPKSVPSEIGLNSTQDSTTELVPCEGISEVVVNVDVDKEDIFEDEPKTRLLPIWLCHSRPRVVDDDTSSVNRGCYSKYFQSSSSKANLEEEDSEKQFLSKKQLRRLRHHERTVAAMKDKRKTKKLRRKQKLAETKKDHVGERIVDSEDRIKITKKEKKMLIRERLLQAQGSAPKVCINLGFASEMDNKELTRLSSQLRRLYGSNRKSSSPLHLHFCNLNEEDDLYKICVAKNDGFSSYVVEMTEKPPEDLFPSEDLVYLSPDSENVLQSLDTTKIYVIGGIVDDTVRKDLSLNHAKQFNIETARLPIAEYLVKYSQNPGTTVLTVNQVFDILLRYYETGDWVESLANHVPLRKGYCAPAKLEDLATGNKTSTKS